MAQTHLSRDEAICHRESVHGAAPVFYAMMSRSKYPPLINRGNQGSPSNKPAHQSAEIVAVGMLNIVTNNAPAPENPNASFLADASIASLVLVLSCSFRN